MLLSVEILHDRGDRLDVRNSSLAKVLNDGLSLSHVPLEHIGRDAGGFEGMPVSSIWSVAALYFQMAFRRGLSPSMPATSATSVILRAVFPLT